MSVPDPKRTLVDRIFRYAHRSTVGFHPNMFIGSAKIAVRHESGSVLRSNNGATGLLSAVSRHLPDAALGST
jgi:hypothetical protein